MKNLPFGSLKFHSKKDTWEIIKFIKFWAVIANKM